MADKDRRRRLKTDQGQYVKVITSAPVPPDGGWGWIVVIATFFLMTFLDGIYTTFSILFVHFREHFGATTATTSWAGSVLGGTIFTSGMLANALAKRYSFRRITIGGMLLAAFSLFVSSFSPNIATLIFFFGFMTGVGLGLVYHSVMVMVGYYFKERRALATGIALCGAGTGTLVFAPFTEYLIDMYDWQGALWIVAAVVSHGVVCGALLRPLEPIVTIVGPTDEEELMMEASPATNSASIEHNGDFTQSANYNVSTVILTTPENRGVHPKVGQNNLNLQLKDSGANLLWNDLNDSPSPRSRCMTHDPSTLRKLNGDYCCQQEDWTMLSRSQDFSVHYSKSRDKHGNSHNHNLHLGYPDVTQPLHRKDIFYGGSPYHIPQYASHSSVNEYAESVTPVADDGTTIMTRCFQWLYILKIARDFLTDMLDWSVLSNITFVIYGVSCFFSTMVVYVPLSYFPTMAIEIGSDSQHAAFFVSVLGITTTVGRIMSGILCDRPWVDILLVNNIGLILAGMATMAVPLYQTYGLMVTYCAFYGILISPFFALRMVIAVELVGLDKLSSALGYLSMAQGIALILGIPMAGALRDATRTFDASFYASGLALILSGTICIPLRRVKQWETTRRERKSENAKKDDENIL